MKTEDIDNRAQTKRNVPLRKLLQKAGSQVRQYWSELPDLPGVYAVCLSGWEDCPINSHAGEARHAEPTDASELRDKRDRILEANWTDILYIGKAGGTGKSTIRNRVRQLARFGVGRAANHKGGSPLWQLNGISEADLHMWCGLRDCPESLEGELLERFRMEHGVWPFANRIGGKRSFSTGSKARTG